MSTAWTMLTPGTPPIEEFYPKALRKEAERLHKIVANVLELRAAADAKRPADGEHSPAQAGADRRAYFRAVAEALQAEVALREELAVFFLAGMEARRMAQHEAREKLEAIVVEIRSLMGLAADTPLLPATLRLFPQYQAARLACDALDWPSESEGGRINNQAARACADRAAEFAAMAEAEEDRWARLVQEQEARQAQRAKEAAEADAGADTIARKVARLINVK